MTDQSRYESILESISGGFCALDREYRIMYWNGAAERGTGLSARDVLGKDIFEVFPNARGATLGEKYRLAMETRTFQSFEARYKDDRFEAWYDVRIYPSDDGLSVFFQDITEEKADKRQKEFLVEMSGAINGSNHLDELCVRAAGTVARYCEVPERAVSIYLYDPRAKEIRLVAPSLLDVEYPEDLVHQAVQCDAPRVASRVAYTCEAVLSEDPFAGTFGALFPGEAGRGGMNSLFVLPLAVGGELQGVMEVVSATGTTFAGRLHEVLRVVADDLAGGMSRRRLVDELRRKNVELESQTQKTLEASDTLKKFLAMFSHELRSPLNSIIGFSDVLATQMDGLPSATVQEFMQTINTSGRHLQQIINDILDLSKIEAGTMEVHIASYPVSYFTDSLRRLLASELAGKNIRLEFDISPEIDELVVDQTRFKQILVNLVSNAVKFSHPEGTVTVRAAREGNDIQFTVEDRGIGVKAEEIPLLFRPFKQAASGRESNTGGVGLGLAITRKLVDKHGGSIWMESVWGEGTRVMVRIPMVVDPTSERMLQAGMLLEALQRENKPTAPGEKPLALIVEDSEQAAGLLRMYIESAGYRVEIAANGADAVEMAKRLHPAVITLDLQLPLKDGWQVMKELKRHPLCRNIPVVIVSIIDEKSLGFSLGAVDYFVKPVSRDDLIQALDRVHLVRRVGQRQPTVLVIDDDRAATDLVQVILENEGYTVLKAFDGKEGVERAVREHPDVIILDLIMPETSGFNVAYQLKHIPATQSIPIIILTSMEIDDSMQERLEAYVAGLMSKSAFTKRELLREIGNVEGSRPR